jgi:hypothetical protein
MSLRIEAIVAPLIFASCGSTPTSVQVAPSTTPAPEVQQRQQPTSTAREYFSLLANELRTKAAAHRLAVRDADQAGKHNAEFEEERKFAREEDLASVYDIAAQEATRAPLCTPLHESEIRDAAADEDETYQTMQPLEQAMPEGTARDQLVKFNKFTQTAAAAFRSDVNACDAIHRLQQEDKQLQNE